MLSSRQTLPELTNRQEEVLNIIISEIESNGFPPTVRELRDHLGVNSLRGATIHLDALEKKGYIQRTGKARGIKVLSKSGPLDDNQAIRIPLIGQVKAGEPVWAEENFEKFINVKTSYLGGYRRAYALRVDGDSMIELGIEPGDLALIYPTQTAENGDIVVALLEDSVTLKKFHRVDNFIALLPANKNYEPIIGKDFDIQGKLIGLIKKEEQYHGSLGGEAQLIPMTHEQYPQNPHPMLKWVYGSTKS